VRENKGKGSMNRNLRECKQQKLIDCGQTKWSATHNPSGSSQQNIGPINKEKNGYSFLYSMLYILIFQFILVNEVFLFKVSYYLIFEIYDKFQI